MPHVFTDRQWSAAFGEFRQSGLTMAEFCRSRRISFPKFRYRFYSPRYRNASTVGSPPGIAGVPATALVDRVAHGFVPVHVRPVPVASVDLDRPEPAAPLELVMADQRLVRVPVGFDAATLDRLLDLLEHRS